MSAWGVFRTILGGGSPQASSAPPPASPAQPARPSPAPANGSGWLAWLPACLSPTSSTPPPRTSPIVIEDAAEDDAMVEEDDLDENDDARKRKCSRGEYGTEHERWAGRISREGVMEDLAKGCPCGCTDLLNVGEVLEARAEMERNDSEGKRTFTRTYLDDNPAPATSGGYNFHPVTDSHRVLCYRGWEVRCARALATILGSVPWSISHALLCPQRRCCMDSTRAGFIGI